MSIDHAARWEAARRDLWHGIGGPPAPAPVWRNAGPLLPSPVAGDDLAAGPARTGPGVNQKSSGSS
ncbi:hypothetical protein [Pseudonocardia phyllosphaerae]|uniref:hypothetical protein n=1 Tax=Pseudonocardia phyllosphaerae TaxID=3390502 RepID=UPI00397AA5BD